jgi:hypothetical protein
MRRDALSGIFPDYRVKADRFNSHEGPGYRKVNEEVASGKV